MIFFKNIAVLVSAGMMIFTISSQVKSAGTESGFYKRNAITIYVGFKRHSAHDRYARVLARHMGRHIPGNPAIKIENTPGAGSLILTNLVYNELPQDGTVIAAVAPHMATAPLLANKQARFDGSKINWLGSMNNEVNVCAVWHTAPVTFWQDLIDRGAAMGGRGAKSDADISTLVLNNILGTKLTLVTNYPADRYLHSAIERGDLDGRCAWSWSTLKATRAHWLKGKQIKILVQMSTTRHPALPDIPLVMDFAKTKLDLQVLKLIFAGQMWGRPYIAGPKVPKARVAALRSAFKKTMTDKRFLQDARRQKLDLIWTSGPAVQKAVAELYRFPYDALAATLKASTDRSNTPVSRAVIPVETASGRITRLQGGGRELFWARSGRTGELRISGSRTKIVIAGQESKRGALKVGMTCTFIFRASSAKQIDCQ